MKIFKTLTPRQLRRGKWSLFVGSLFTVYAVYQGSTVARANPACKYNDIEFESCDTVELAKGKIHYFSTNTEVCNR